MSEEQPGGRRDNRFVRRASYAAALVVSGLSVAISALGLAGAFDGEPKPSAPVAAAASEIAAYEHRDGSCGSFDGDGDRLEGEKGSLKSRV